MILFLLACGTQTAERPTIQEPPSHLESTSNPDITVLQQLSVRDGFSCSQLVDNKELQAELSRIVEEVSKPPWAPMRAAACLIERYSVQAKPDFERWIVDPSKKGLAFLIAGQIEKMPDEVALSVVKLGLAGPHALDIRVRLEKINDPRLQTILQPSQ